MQALFFDFGRAYIDSSDIDDVFLKNFPGEAKWNPLAPREDNIITNMEFTNDVPWIEPVREIPSVSAEHLSDLTAAAAKLSGGIAVIGSAPALLSIRAGVDYFAPRTAGREIIFMTPDTRSHERNMKKLEGADFSAVLIDNGELSPKERFILDEVKALLRKKYAGEQRLYSFAPDSAGAFFMGSAFKGAASILSPPALFILAACGIDIKEIAAGAELEPLPDSSFFIPQACGDGGVGKEYIIPSSYTRIKYYSLIRHLMAQRGKAIEIFRWLDPRLNGIAAWVKELFLENSPSLYADSIFLSGEEAALYAGEKNFFETFLDFGDCKSSVSEDIKSAGEMDAMNKSIMDDAVRKRSVKKVPVLRIEILSAEEYSYGSLAGFLFRTSRMSWH
ncbi:MAG: hypothetical protein LBT84_06295 [Spirochaetia bacterium]|nr:hypothetical protein [Spirochaetia bacterium]